MSSKSSSIRSRYWNKTYTKIVDVDTPSNNSEGIVESSFLVDNLEQNSGEDRANWKALLASGSFAGNQVTATRTTWDHQPFSCNLLIERKRLNGSPPGRIVYRREQTDYLSKYYSSLTAPPAGNHIPEARTEATRRFVSNARQKLSPASLGVTFGELNETLGMLHHPGAAIVKRIGSYLTKVNKNLRRNKRAPVKKRNEVVANTWLEYSFGWAPFLGDMKNIAAAAQKERNGLKSLYVVGKGTAETSVNEAGGSLAYPGAGSHAFDITRKTSTDSWCYGELKPEFGDSGNFPEAFGLYPRDILPTIWELVPWSFAIDYFTGVGDFISSMTFPTTSLSWYMRSTHTKVVRSTSNYRVTGDQATQSVNLSIKTNFNTGKAACTVEAFARERPSTFSLITPVRFSLPANKLAYVNLGALLKVKLSNQRRQSK